MREYDPQLFQRNVGVAFSEQLVLFKPVGCDKCRQTGYVGRMALHELLMGTDEIKRLIQTGASVEMLRQSGHK